MTMASIPENWESDYDGDRWFFRFKPTGLVQYTFPKPGDEYPEFIDVFSPPLELSPEERLESHYQVKRRDTEGGGASASQTGKSKDGLTSATMAGPGDDGGNFWYQPDGLMYMGPGGYTDISPEEEDEAESAGFKRISPVISAETTPLASNSHPATSPPLKKIDTVDVGDAGRTNGGAAESPDDVPLLYGRQIQSPVGYMAELASEQTARCREETHPAPVELPTHDMTTEAAAEPLMYANAFDMAPVELPAHKSPVIRHAHAMGLDQKVLISPLQDPHKTKTRQPGDATAHQPPQMYQAQAPVRQYSMPLPTDEPSQSFTMPAQPTPGNYQAYKPGRHADPVEHNRGPGMGGDHFPTRGAVDGGNVAANAKRYSLAGPIPPRPLPQDVPAVLQPPQVPPKQSLGRDDNDSYMLPGPSARHESISDPPSISLDHVGPQLVPSILQPAGGRASAPRPSLQDHRAHSTPNYQPYNPYRDLEEHIESTAQLYSQSQPSNNRESNTRSVRPGQVNPSLARVSVTQASLDMKPVGNAIRANTLPLDMPALPYMGIDPSHRAPPAAVQTIPESPRQPASQLSAKSSNPGQQGKMAVKFGDYSSPTIKSPDFPEPLKSFHKQPTDVSNSQSHQTHGWAHGDRSADTLPHQQSATTPDRKTRIQSLDSAAGNSAPATTATRRVSLSDPSHGFIVQNSAMPPPSVQSLRTESAGTPRIQSSPSHSPPINGIKDPRVQTQIPPTPGSQFHQREQGSGPMGRPAPARPHPPRGQVIGDKPSAVQTQGGVRRVPRPVSMILQPQEANRPLHSRPSSVTAERAERLPTPQPVPLPTPPTPQQTYVNSGSSQSTSQPRRVPLPVPVPQPSPVPRPSSSQPLSLSQPPPRPDKTLVAHVQPDIQASQPPPSNPQPTSARHGVLSGPGYLGHHAVQAQSSVPLPHPGQTRAVQGSHIAAPIHPPMTQQPNLVQQPNFVQQPGNSFSPHNLGPPQPFIHVIPQQVGGIGAPHAMYFPPGGISQQAFLPQAAAGAVPQGAFTMVSSSPPVYPAQNIEAGREKERWFGKVFKSGSVKKQNPFAGIVPVSNDGTSGNKSTGGRSTPDSTTRNKLQKSQPMTIQMDPEQAQPNTNVYAHTASPLVNPVTSPTVLVHTPTSQGSTLVQPSGPYFQPATGIPQWANPQNAAAPDGHHFAQQGLPQQRQQIPQPVGSFVSRQFVTYPLQSHPPQNQSRQSQQQHQYPSAETQQSLQTSQQSHQRPVEQQSPPDAAANRRPTSNPKEALSRPVQSNLPTPEHAPHHPSETIPTIVPQRSPGKGSDAKGLCQRRESKGQDNGDRDSLSRRSMAGSIATAARENGNEPPSPPASAPASKWDSSGYDGSGWGDDDEDEYDYDGGYGRGGYGGGYR